MRGCSVLLACMLLGPGSALLPQTPQSDQPDDQAAAPAQTSPAQPIVRLRYVQGQVSILQGKTVEFARAKANMPVLAGSTLAAGADGQAEVEFADGSVARLTPNSQLRLVRLPAGDVRSGEANAGPTNLELLSGLAYFELNTAEERRYAVRFGRAVAQPTENSIFRIDLDDTPELAVFLGAVEARADGGFDQAVEQGESLRLPGSQGALLSANIRQDSWDRWNQDRDDLIASQAQQQTAAGEQSAAAGEPGWNDLDQYGDWYPTEQYGNVWVPADEAAGWDPYSSGYWANYPGWGYTWISAYPWGWLPYQCGAWNYWDSFGWGWIPGQCSWGAQPTVIVWNAPPGFHAPPRPRPGGHIGTPTTTLLAVHRGPATPANGLLSANHTRPVRIDGRRLDPLPIIERPGPGQGYQPTGRVGVPVPVGAGSGSVLLPGAGVRSGSGISIWPRSGSIRPLDTGSGSLPRPTGGAPPSIGAPRITPVSPGVGAPRVGLPAPAAPRVSAPAPSAPSAPHSSNGTTGTTNAAHPH